MKIAVNKRQIVVILTGFLMSIVVLLSVFIYLPLYHQSNDYVNHVERLKENIKLGQSILSAPIHDEVKGRLIAQDEIALAINEIMKAGRLYNINFVSVNPKEITKLEDSEYHRLPIQLSLESEYKDFGLFLNDLEQLKTSIISVRNFTIDRDDNILPLVRTELMLEVYLKDG